MSMLIRLRTKAVLSVFAVAAIAAIPEAGAQPVQEKKPAATSPRLPVTPFIAMGDDYAPGGGASVMFPLTGGLGAELEASLGTDAARSSLSLVYSIHRWKAVQPFLAGGAGVQRDEWERGVPDVGFVVTKKTEFAVNVGGGIIVPARDGWQYRVDFRWYNPKREWPESWRIYSGVTFGLGRND